MHQHQRGLSLLGVAIFSALLALLAMAGLYSVRYDRNVFAEAWAKVSGGVAATPAGEAVDAARRAAAGATGAATAGSAAGGALRKCVIDGKTVISNTDCSDKNPTSRDIKIVDTRGVEAPKAPPPPPADSAPTSDPALDKIIEKQTSGKR